MPCDHRSRGCNAAAVSQRMPSVDSQPQKAGKGMEGFCPETQTEMAPLTPWFWASGFQSCERIYFSCFKPTHLWYFLTAALGHKCKPLCISYCTGLQSWLGVINSPDGDELGLLTKRGMGRRVRNQAILIPINWSLTWRLTHLSSYGAIIVSEQSTPTFKVLVEEA